MAQNSVLHLPALRRGVPYESLDTVSLESAGDGTSLAEVSLVNSGLIRRDILSVGSAQRALATCSCRELIEICERAADLFLSAPLPVGLDARPHTTEDYISVLSACTGLPNRLCRSNMEKIAHVLRHMETVIRGLSRDLNPEILDQGLGNQFGLDLSFFPVTDCLGVVLPSNSPGVNSLWLPAVPLKIPVILKPGREDPWTPYRIIQALTAAGCPQEAFGFYPTDHEGADSVLQLSGRSIVFGGDQTVRRYAGNPRIQIHGAGRSKVLIGADKVDQWPEFIDVIAESITANGGRSCINASSVWTPAYANDIAQALVERLSAIRPRASQDPEATLAGFANSAMAEAIDALIDQGLEIAGASDLSAQERQGNRCVKAFGQTFLLPTIVRCQSVDHPLANTEFLFPYASVLEVPQDQMLSQIGPSLAVTAITDDRAWTAELLRSEDLERLNLGKLPTSVVQWDQPHEGNLFDFLYRRRAVQRNRETAAG